MRLSTRHEDADDRQRHQERDRTAIERTIDEAPIMPHRPPLQGEQATRRFWMNRMISTRMAILPSTGTANGRGTCWRCRA